MANIFYIELNTKSLILSFLPWLFLRSCSLMHYLVFRLVSRFLRRDRRTFYNCIYIHVCEKCEEKSKEEIK